MTKKFKIVLRGEDGMTEHAQGLVDVEKYADTTILERNLIRIDGN